MIKIIKKADVQKFFNDPDIAYIERHIKSLEALIAKRPERRELIIEKLSQSGRSNVELNQAATAAN